MFRKLLAGLGYAVLFLVSTLIFSYFMFPLDRLVEYIEAKVNASSRYQLEIDSVEQDGLGKLVLTDVTIGVSKKLLKRPNPGTADIVGEKVERGAGDDFTYLEIDEISIDFGLLQLLGSNDLTFSISMALLGGNVSNAEVRVNRDEKGIRFALSMPSIEGVRLGETEFFGSFFSALFPSVRTNRVNGVLESGSVVLEPGRDEDGSWYSGRIDAELADIVALAPILVQRLKRTGEVVEIPLTDMRLGRCTFNIRVDRKDRMEELDKVKTKHKAATAILFEKGECKGESLDYYIKRNSFILFPPKGALAKGKMDLWTKLAFNPDYFEEDRLEGTDRVTHNRELGQGLEFDSMWQKAQDVDGFYWMHCKGTLLKPKCKRGLPAEEKRRKAALKELKKKQEKERADAARKARKPTVPDRQTRGKSAALGRAEKLRKEREAREQPTLREVGEEPTRAESAPLSGRPTFGISGAGEAESPPATKAQVESEARSGEGSAEGGAGHEAAGGEEGSPGDEGTAGEGEEGAAAHEAPAGEEGGYEAPAGEEGYEAPAGEERAPTEEPRPGEEENPNYGALPGEEAPGDHLNQSRDVRSHPDTGSTGYSW